MMPAKEWLAALERLSLTEKETVIAESAPAVKLLPFFQTVLESSQVTRLDCALSLKESTHLCSSSPLSIRDTNLWISYWKSQKVSVM